MTKLLQAVTTTRAWCWLFCGEHRQGQIYDPRKLDRKMNLIIYCNRCQKQRAP